MRNILLSTATTLALALAAPALAQSSPTTPEAGQAGTDQDQAAKKHHKKADQDAPPASDASSTDPAANPGANANGAAELGDGASGNSTQPPSSPQL